MQQVAGGVIIQSCREDICIARALCTPGPTDTCVLPGNQHNTRAQSSALAFTVSHAGRASSYQQVSLARSPLLKNEDSNCEGLLLTSYDRTLVVKEICSEEVEEMHDILSEYHQVVQSLAPNTSCK